MIDWKIRPVYCMKTDEQKYVDAAKCLDDIVISVIRKNKDLSQEVSEKDSKILEMQSKLDTLSKEIVSNRDFLNSITPIKVYYTRKRKSTTVKFLDGNQVTVHRMKGDKHCLETAIVYAIFKKLYPKKLLANLVNDITYVGGRRCKKR